MEKEENPDLDSSQESLHEKDVSSLEEMTHEGQLDDRVEAKGLRRLGMTSVSFSGPLPPPDLLQKYKDIQSDFPERILRLTEREAEHRHDITRKAVWLDGAEIFLGQIFGLIVALAAFVVAGYLGYLGLSAASSIIGGGAIAGLVAVFIKGRSNSQTTEESDDD